MDVIDLPGIRNRGRSLEDMSLGMVVMDRGIEGRGRGIVHTFGRRIVEDWNIDASGHEAVVSLSNEALTEALALFIEDNEALTLSAEALAMDYALSHPVPMSRGL